MLDAIVIFLLSQMDDRSFRKREAATAVVEIINCFSDIRPLLRSKFDTSSVEVRKRIESVIDRYEIVFPTGKDYLPRLMYIPKKGADDKIYEKCHEILTEFHNYWSDSDQRMMGMEYVSRCMRAGETRTSMIRRLNQAIEEEGRNYITPHE